jgi:XTP/dITP diphosphohydrolase
VSLALVLATANAGKAAEIEALLGPLGIVLVPRPADLPRVEESGSTLEDNARRKAEAVLRATGLPAVADDTGLEVCALGGAPGVHAARYAGPAATDADNVARLLAELEGVEDRRARFRTVALVAWPDGTETLAEGATSGTIARSPRGHNGFGYDPVFVPDEGDGRTFAEMALGDKAAVSHRGRAFRRLAELLQRRAGSAG